MLTQIREGISRWLAWVIVVLISVPFALWGINSYFEGVNQIDVAVVDGVEIDYQDYQRSLSERQRTLSRSFGSQLGASYFGSLGFKRQVIDSMVDEILLDSDVQNQGYRVSDVQLLTQIQSTPSFQRDGQFDPELYQQMLRSAGYTAQRFEQSQRRQSAIGQVETAYTVSSFVPQPLLDNVLKLSGQSRTAEYVILENKNFLDKVDIDETELDADYQANLEDYRAPARIKVEYLELSVDELSQSVEVSEEDLQRLYDTDGERYTTPEQRMASHILINVANDADEETAQEAKRKAEDLVHRARDGEDFAELAKANSDDAGSANNGGDLGIIERGVMVKPFEDAVYQMQADEISEPVRSQFGFHVIKLTSLSEEKRKSFEEARSEIEKEEKQRQGEAQFLELSEQFRNLVYEQPESLEPSAQELDLEIQQSDWFSENTGVGVASAAAVRLAAFGDDVLNNDLNSEAIETSVDSLVAVRRLDYEESKVKPFEEVRAQIEEKLKRERSAELAESTMDGLLEKLNTGESWEDTISNAGLTSQTLPKTRKQASGSLVLGISKMVFEAVRPGAGQSVFGGGSISTGYYGVYKLDNVEDTDVSSLDEEEVQNFTAALKRRWGDEQLVGYRDSLRSAADITIYENQL